MPIKLTLIQQAYLKFDLCYKYLLLHMIKLYMIASQSLVLKFDFHTWAGFHQVHFKEE